MKRKVAVIDSGVDKNDPLLQGKDIENLCYSQGKFQNCYISTNMHGTEVVKVLLHEAPDIELLSVRVLQEDNRCMISAVLKALRYCIDEKVDIINLSLGSLGTGSRHIKEMQSLCDEAQKQSIAVFAANHNQPGMTSYPANFHNVIGVNTTGKMGQYCRISFENKMVDFSENMVFIPDDTQCVIRKGNSYLCPFIVGLFCCYIGERQISRDLIEAFMRFLDDFSAARRIGRIFLDRTNQMEYEGLDGKRILYFADEWDYNNQQIFHFYEERARVRWCFQEIYQKDPVQVENLLADTDIFFIGALGNAFMRDNEDYLQRLIETVAGKSVEILMVFPVLNTFERMNLTATSGHNVKSFYK